MSEAIRWTIKVSKQTDLDLRTLLGAQGMKKGDLSKFVEESVRWSVFNRRVQAIKDRFRDVPPAELEAQIDKAIKAVRKGATRRAR